MRVTFLLGKVSFLQHLFFCLYLKGWGKKKFWQSHLGCYPRSLGAPQWAEGHSWTLQLCWDISCCQFGKESHSQTRDWVHIHSNEAVFPSGGEWWLALWCCVERKVLSFLCSSGLCSASSLMSAFAFYELPWESIQVHELTPNDRSHLPGFTSLLFPLLIHPLAQSISTSSPPSHVWVYRLSIVWPEKKVRESGMEGRKKRKGGSAVFWPVAIIH